MYRGTHLCADQTKINTEDWISKESPLGKILHLNCRKCWHLVPEGEDGMDDRTTNLAFSITEDVRVLPADEVSYVRNTPFQMKADPA